MKHKGKRLAASERPLFAPVTAVHKTAKDKANSRQSKKLEIKHWKEKGE